MLWLYELEDFYIYLILSIYIICSNLIHPIYNHPTNAGMYLGWRSKADLDRNILSLAMQQEPIHWRYLP